MPNDSKEIGLTAAPSAGLIVGELLSRGAMLLENAFSQEYAEHLADEAARLDYSKQPETYGKRQVRQEVSSVQVQPGSIFGRFADTVQQQLYLHLGARSFQGRLRFNDRVIQLYDDASLGIQPHRDHKSNINLVVLCGLRGSGRFSVYKELGREASLHLSIVPGSILLLRAPGFAGTTDCPVHGVDQIVGPRYLLGLRQNTRLEV